MKYLISILLITQLFLAFNSYSATSPEEDDLNSEQFEEKLHVMLDRTEKSVKLTRDQIVQSSNAPFLAQLYMNLADLLSQKSNTLYYLQMEKTKKSGGTGIPDKALNPVVEAQQEAINIYKRILSDFPKFDRRSQALFRMALAQKSIDEVPSFLKTSSTLLSTYPGSEEAMKVRLLIGQYHFEQGDNKEAMTYLKPVSQVKFDYERNLAKYRIGLIYISQEKFRDALLQFEQVIQDPTLKEQDNPYEISLKTKSFKTDLKREALIDSIRCYTKVYDKDPHPVEYYSKLAPTENHFQEVIEKLSLRYINLKKYDHAIQLLRTLSERTPDVQKIINIYHEVLLMIPIKERINVPYEEMRFLLEKFNEWISFYEIPKRTYDLAYNFFEKQIRDLGTTAHSYAKAEKNPQRKTFYLKRSRDFYLLYISYFGQNSNQVKLATNLADVYFAMGDYLRSGDYYLRVYQEEFGKPSTNDKRALLENAILCLQKRVEQSFYENVRMKGLLIKSIALYTDLLPLKKNDAKLAFVSLKAEYEQGFFPEVLDKAFEFMRKFRHTIESVSAGELILDYFNTRNEFAGLETWATKMLSLKLSNPAFNQKLATIEKQARSKVLNEKVKAISGYDETAQGKSFLTAALSSDDPTLRNEALKQALARSKSEKDIKTFLEAAQAMADKEKDPKKKQTILSSIAHEKSKIGDFYGAIEKLQTLIQDNTYGKKDKVAAFEEAVQITLLLRDWNLLEKLLKDPMSGQLPQTTKIRVRDQIADLLETPVQFDRSLLYVLFSMGLNDDMLTSLYKSQHRLDEGYRTKLKKEIDARCGSQSKQLVCRWQNLNRVDQQIEATKSAISSSSRALASIEPTAQKFSTMITYLQGLEGSGDPLYELVLSLRTKGLYQSFANYLNDAASANPDVQAVLKQKANETLATAKIYNDRCFKIAERSAAAKKGVPYCKSGKAPDLNDLLSKKEYTLPTPPGDDPSSADIEEIQRLIFSSKDASSATYDLAKLYLNKSNYNHAAALAMMGISTYKPLADSFKVILGCSLVKLGIYDEAQYHLKSSKSPDEMKNSCMSEVNRMQSL